jgi:hypothetical protein
MKNIEIEITGTTSLLQHRMGEEELFKLLGARQEKKKSKEELEPRQIAERCAYKAADGTFYIPLEYVVGAFKHVASDYKQKSTSRRSMKTVAAGVFRPAQETATLLKEDGTPITTFEVDIRKATNHQKGAVAVCRPRFDRWKARFTMAVDDSILAPEMAHEILNDAGKRSGIGSFRVSRGGYFGQFRVTEWKETN